MEREAADLRRENGWLKEIVMLKGSRTSGLNLANHFSENAESSTDPKINDHESQGSSDEAKAKASSSKKKRPKKK